MIYISKLFQEDVLPYKFFQVFWMVSSLHMLLSHAWYREVSSHMLPFCCNFASSLNIPLEHGAVQELNKPVAEVVVCVGVL